MPELMKMRPDIIKTMQDLNDSPADIESALLENNPEWEERLEKSGITRKMQELSEMQNDGADLLMVTFPTLSNSRSSTPLQTGSFHILPTIPQ